MKTLSINKLNKLTESRPVTLQYFDRYFTLNYFMWLKLGDDCFDKHEKDQGYCGLNAYVYEMPERIPFEDIKDIWVGEKIKLK